MRYHALYIGPARPCFLPAPPFLASSFHITASGRVPDFLALAWGFQLWGLA